MTIDRAKRIIAQNIRITLTKFNNGVIIPYGENIKVLDFVGFYCKKEVEKNKDRITENIKRFVK